MTINNSPDINSLIVQTTFDISGVLPSINLVNMSAGPNLAGLTTWFVATAPGNIPIHEGSETSPDITGEWTDFTLSDSWPRAFNNIIWSGGQYLFTTYVKDSNGNIFSFAQSVSICRPSGNKPTSTNTYGLATCDVQVKCDDARVYFQDTTFHTYKGIDGEFKGAVLRVLYPVDETGNVPAPFVAVNFTNAAVPITYSSDNYQFQSYCIYDYDFGNYTLVRIRYQSFNPVNGSPAVRFAVLCNIDLCALFCEVDKLVRDIESGNCVNVEQANQKLMLINPKMLLIFMGIQQPLCGIDVPGLIEQVKAIGGFTCDCCNAPTGIIPTKTSPIDGYNFSVVTNCGDTTGQFQKTGNNIVLTLAGVTYNFKYCDTSPAETTAFSFYKTLDNCIAEVCLNVDMSQLAFDLANIIKSNGELLNLWQSLFNTGGEFDLIVDGGCIFQTTSTCDYVFTLNNIPPNTTYALLNSITVAGVAHSLSYSFNLTNLAGLQTYLNSLGYGTFSVLQGPAQTVNITSNANSNNIQALTYKISGITYIADLAKNCTGYVPISANQVVQNIINYICGITDADIQTAADYEICYIDPTDGVSKTQTVAAGAELNTFIAALLERGCDTITYIKQLNTPDCAGMKDLFPASVDILQANDSLFGTKAGKCASIQPVELGTRQLQLGINDVNFMAAFCAAVQVCGGGLPCAPYNVFNLSTSPVDTGCPDIIDMAYNFVGSDLHITGVTFVNAPAAAQTLTVEYKLHVAGSYTLASNAVAVNANGSLVTPLVISLIAGDQYDIRISNNCQSPPSYFVNTITVPNTTNGWEITYTNNIPSINITLYIGNNNSAPSTLIYSGTYSSDPLSGINVNLPAVNANVLMIISGQTYASANCNAVAGTISGGATIAQWSGVNGPLTITFVTT